MRLSLREIGFAAGRLLICYVAIVVLLALAGSTVVSTLSELTNFTTQALGSEYEMKSLVVDQEQVIAKATYQALDASKPHTYTIRASLFSLLVGPILSISIISAWAVASNKRRLVAFAVALPLLVIQTLLDMPFILREQMMKMITGHSDWLLEPWAFFLTNGGRLMMGTIIGLLCVALVQRDKMVCSTPD